MIEALMIRSGVACCGGFVAYYNDMSVYAPDPALPFSRAVAILVCADRQLLICPIDMTKPEEIPDRPPFVRISRSEFGARSTGALFASGRYFSIRSGPLTGSYQISDDMLINDDFPNARAYRRFLLMKDEA